MFFSGSLKLICVTSHALSEWIRANSMYSTCHSFSQWVYSTTQHLTWGHFKVLCGKKLGVYEACMCVCLWHLSHLCPVASCCDASWNGIKPQGGKDVLLLTSMSFFSCCLFFYWQGFHSLSVFFINPPSSHLHLLPSLSQCVQVAYLSIVLKPD